MNEEPSYYENLIAAYFSGEATPEEVRLLSEWLTKDQANPDTFEAYRQTWLLAAKDAVQMNTSLESDWENVRSAIDAQPSTPASTVQARPRGRIAELITSWKAVAALAILLALASAVFYFYAGPDVKIISAEAANAAQILPDGSVVMLYKGSVIEYPSSFLSGKREVFLDGEAYFDVKHDAAHPFVVRGGKAKISVLGTSFNVNTHAGNNTIRVSLTTGKVELGSDGSKPETATLRPGEQADINTVSGEITTKAIDDPNYMAWKTKEIRFDHTPLGQVVETLVKVYQTDIRLNNDALYACSLTATFENQPLNSVLNVLRASLDVTIDQQNGIYLISGNGCN